MNAIIDFYVEGNSRKKTCKKFNITDKKLVSLLSNANVYIRTQKEQAVIENIKRTKKVDHDFFEKLDNKNVYYIGFFAADASVRKKRNEIKIGLSSVDKDFLENMRRDFGIEKQIKLRETNNGFECAELSFSSLKIKNTLAKYSVVPNKTYIGITMKNIPHEYRLSFIKGFFDGDGSFSFNKNTKQCKLSFASYKSEILYEIKDYFGLPGNIYKSKNKNLYTLEYSTINAIKIMDMFYKLNTRFLERKQKKYFNYLELRNKNPRDKSPSH